MNKNDIIRLQHMIDAACEAVSFVEGKERSELDKNRMLVLSLVRCIEIVGEAASTISPECKTKFPYIPWRDIVAMRNRLIHAYFNVNLDIVWVTVQEELPLLITQLEQILSED